MNPQSTINPMDGIWIYSAYELDLYLLGDNSKISARKNLSKGWNAIGFPGDSADASSIFSTLSDKWQYAFGWDASNQHYEPTIFNGDQSSSTPLVSGKGYWIYLNGPAEYSLPIPGNNISQSKEALLQIIGPDNNLTFMETWETDYGTYHKFSTPNWTIYYVNSMNGYLERVEKRNQNFTADVRLSLNEAEYIAQSYVDKFSINQNRSGLAIVKSQLLDHGAFKEYTVEFRETVDGVLFPNLAYVSINPANGELQSYFSINQEVFVSLKPNLTKEEAVSIAIGQFPGIIVRSQDAILEVENVPDKGQKLVWRITIEGEPVDMVAYGGSVIIDAMDGAVLFKDAFS